jgi:hypothetical protein
MKYGSILGGMFFACAAMFGVFVAVHSWNGAIYFSTASLSKDVRTPAAIRKDLDFSHLDGAELITASQKRLVTAARIILQNDDVGVELGHFVTRGATGDRQLACDFYDRVSLQFEAEGVADNGEKPMMQIEAPCRTGTDITRIEPIWIPVKKLQAEHATDMDISYPEQEGVNFRFSHMTGAWPGHWALHSVRLFNGSESGRIVDISNHELHDILHSPLTVNWQNARVPAAQPTNQ